MQIRHLLHPHARSGWRLLLALLLAGVAGFAFLPGSPFDGPAHTDKLQHVLAFATLALVAALAWSRGTKAEAWIAGGLLLYGLLIELVQTQLPTRTGSAADLLADAAGIALGLLLVRQIRRRIRNRGHSD